MSSRVKQMIGVCALSLLIAGCRSPQADALIAEQMRQIGDELNSSRQETAVMHERIDSLTTLVARQDTVLRQLALVAGVPMPIR